MKSELIKILSERGFIHQCTDLDALDDLCAKGPITAYIGFDLTANSLHVGSLLQIMLLRWLVKTGNNPIILMGEATTRIGDPTGKDKARPMLGDEQILDNYIGIQKVFDALVLKPNLDRISDIAQVSNIHWFGGMQMMDYLRQFGPHFTINRMLTFDSVQTRLSKQDPMSFLEFNYMLMQAIDFLHLARQRDCVLQLGGSDQWGNIVNGVELVRRVDQKQVFGLTTPLMTNSAGEKMGKTANGAIWLDKDKTSAFEFWQFWRNVEDAKVGEFLKLFTELPVEECERLAAMEGSAINHAKKMLATEVTALVHGRETARHTALAAEAVFEAGKFDENMPTHVVHESAFQHGLTLAQIMLDAGLVPSKTEARKIAANRGVKINGAHVLDVSEPLPRRAFEGNTFRLSVGKKKVVAVRIDA